MAVNEVIVVTNALTAAHERHCGNWSSVDEAVQELVPGLQNAGYITRCDQGVLFVFPATSDPITTALIVITVVSAGVAYHYASQTPSSPDIDYQHAQSGSYASVGLRRNIMRQSSVIPRVYGKVLLFPDLISKPFQQTFAQRERFYSVMSISEGAFAVDKVSVVDPDSSLRVPVTPSSSRLDLIKDTDYSNSKYFTGGASAFGYDYVKRLSLPVDSQHNIVAQGDVVLPIAGKTVYVELRYFRGGGNFSFQITGDARFVTRHYNVTDRGVFTGSTQVFTAPAGSKDDNAFTLPITHTGSITISKQKPPYQAATYRTELYWVPAGESSGRWDTRQVLVTPASGYHDPPAGSVLNLRQAYEVYQPPSGVLKKAGTYMSGFVGEKAVVKSARPSIAVEGSAVVPTYLGKGAARKGYLSDALVDIAITGGIARKNIDISAIRALDATWRARGDEFNAIYDKPGNVFDALKAAAFCGRAKLIRRNNDTITFWRDQYQPAITMSITAAMLVQGSCKLNYRFNKNSDHDGIEVRYRDPTEWTEKNTKWPTTAQNPDKITLFGCTSQLLAQDAAKYYWALQQYRRRSVEFVLEREGFILLPGNRVKLTLESKNYDLLVLSVTPRDRMRVHLKCVDYDERIYKATGDPVAGALVTKTTVTNKSITAGLTTAGGVDNTAITVAY